MSAASTISLIPQLASALEELNQHQTRQSLLHIARFIVLSAIALIVTATAGLCLKAPSRYRSDSSNSSCPARPPLRLSLYALVLASCSIAIAGLCSSRYSAMSSSGDSNEEFWNTGMTNSYSLVLLSIDLLAVCSKAALN